MNFTTDNESSATWKIFISKGGDEAFSKIYNCHYDVLYYMGMRYTADTQVIEDSIQNVFVYLLKNRNKLTPVTNVRGYLLKSFRRQLFLDLKKQKKLFLPDKLFETQFDYFSSTEEVLFEKEELHELHGALKKSIGKLSARQQEIIYLRFDCEMSYEEISGILEISVDSCYKSIYRSIKTIKADIEQMLAKGSDLLLWFIFRLKKIHLCK